MRKKYKWSPEDEVIRKNWSIPAQRRAVGLQKTFQDISNATSKNVTTVEWNQHAAAQHMQNQILTEARILKAEPTGCKLSHGRHSYEPL